MQSAWKVGTFVVIFAVLFLGAFSFLEKSFFAKPVDLYYASFEDAGGVATGSAILLSGVKVGQVQKVELVSPNEARLELALDKGTKIPVGSKMLIPASFISIGDMKLQIVPPKSSNEYMSPGETLAGSLATPLSSFAPEGGKTLEEINKTLVALQDLLSDKGLKAQLTQLMATVTDTSKKFGNVASSVDGLIAANSKKFSSLLDSTGSTLKNMQAVSVEIKKLVQSGEMQAKTTELLDNLNAAVIQGKTLVTDLQGFVNDPEMRTSMKDTLANFKIMSDSGTRIAADAEKMASNGVEISAETKVLMGKANKLADQVQELIEKFNKTIDKVGSQGKSIGQGIEYEATTAQQSGPGRLRSDLNIFFPVGKDKLMFGLYDAFESNKINLQMKKQVGANLGLRYGVYGSKPGIGVDYDVAPKLNLRGDFFGLNDPRFDMRLGYTFGQQITGWIGLDRIFERQTPSIGVTIRK